MSKIEQNMAVEVKGRQTLEKNSRNLSFDPVPDS